ncbi:hypothetical protein ADK65_25000 [Streptomyces sp. NRRL B-1140]|nr:hypothetical protein ADK65_25000 [Streptomyces sp. NRRL B-1140]
MVEVSNPHRAEAFVSQRERTHRPFRPPPHDTTPRPPPRRMSADCGRTANSVPHGSGRSWAWQPRPCTASSPGTA